jgi:hypothetical protein
MVARFDLRGGGAFWAATVLAGLSLVLVLVNGFLARGNQSARQEVNQRQLSIDEWAREGRQNQDLIQLLVAASARGNDTAIRDLLARNGITFSVSQPAAPTGEGAASPAGANAPQHKP